MHLYKCINRKFTHKMLPSVSILTVSNVKRVPFLKILSECIKIQDYTNIKEWVILDSSGDSSNGDSSNDSKNKTLEPLINDLRSHDQLPPIVYKLSDLGTRKCIGALREESNQMTTGDIIVCMDDDDYYPPQRVSHAVDKLKDSDNLIAGCDKLYLYDIHYDKIFQFRGFAPYHSTNNCLAYKKEYIIDHHYNPENTYAEENAFTNDFSEPLVQLDSDKTILQFGHDENTYNKKHIIYSNFVLSRGYKYLLVRNFTVSSFIKNDLIYDMYRQLFDKLLAPVRSVYDIVYFTGGFSIQWDPHDNSLGGSEQAVKHLTEQWAAMGKKVAVYGNLKWEGVYNGVDYQKYDKFKFWQIHNVLILWRAFGCQVMLDQKLRADKLLIDLHDHTPDLYELVADNAANRIDAIMVKSIFHKELVENVVGHPVGNALVVPNGIRIREFQENPNVQRMPYRFCYCSCYTRGLQRILQNIWPVIYRLEPRAEFHVYYGMDLVRDSAFKMNMTLLLGQPGVMDHGRQPVHIVNREKHMSTFQLYYTDCVDEVDCISIRESLVAGCIPLISNAGVFMYRDGLQMRWLPDTPEANTQIGESIVGMMNNVPVLDRLREKYKESQTIVSWEQVAKEWLKYM